MLRIARAHPDAELQRSVNLQMVRHTKGCQRRRTQLRRADAELALDLLEGRRSSAEMFGKLDSA